MKKLLLLALSFQLSVLSLMAQEPIYVECMPMFPQGEYLYTGDSIKPEWTWVSWDEETACPDMVEGVDYTVQWFDNVEPGWAYVWISCIGNYMGDFQASFAITQPAVPDELDETESALLLSIQQTLDRALTWEVTIEDGHVTAFDFSQVQEGLPFSIVPELFKFPYVRTINISGNGLSGDIEQLVDPQHIACAGSLTEFYSSYNQLSGNIGAFAAHFPNLTTLIASNNRLTGLHPMISPNVTELELYYQTWDEPVIIDTRNRLTPADLTASIPEIITYNHGMQTYNTGLEWSISFPYSAGFNLMPCEEEDEQTYIGVFSWGWDRLVLTGHDTVHITSNIFISADCPFTLLYRMADVNFSGTIDVTDLQALINDVTLNTYFNPINSNAADLYPDSLINVQDVVRMVDTLLAHEVPVVFEAPRRTMSTETAEAELYWLNGDLHLRSGKAVAAMQMTIATEGTIEWHLGNEWIHTQAAANNGFNAVVYSLSGSTIPAETDVVIAHCTDEATVRYAKLSDAQAKPIRVHLSANAPTGIDENDQMKKCENVKIIRDGQLIIIRDNKMYNAQGQQIRD